MRHSLYEPAQVPAGSGASNAGLQTPKRPKLRPRARSTASGSSREQAEKCCRRSRPAKGSVLADRRSPAAGARQPEPPPATSRTPPFTTTQFHVLLNSLFKVLFNFPSRYLFAIGLGVIFSLAWSLPRALSCTPKQLDSREKSAQSGRRLTGLSPSTGRGPSQGGLELAIAGRGDSPEHHIPRDLLGRRFGAGLCPFHSPLLGASQLFSFPPLINMLKFSGCSCLISGREV